MKYYFSYFLIFFFVIDQQVIAQFAGAKQVQSSIDGKTVSFTTFMEEMEKFDAGVSAIISQVKIKLIVEKLPN